MHLERLSSQMRILILTVAAFALSSVPASAVTLVNPDGSRAEPFQTWAEQVSATPDATVLMRSDLSLCGGAELVLGCALSPGWTAPREIVLMSPPCSSGVSGYQMRTCKYALYHQIGYHFSELMPAWKQRVFRRIIDHRDGDWYSEDRYGSNDAERFSDAYALCAAGNLWPDLRVSKNLWIGVSYLTTKQFRRSCKLIRQSD